MGARHKKNKKHCTNRSHNFRSYFKIKTFQSPEQKNKLTVAGDYFCEMNIMDGKLVSENIKNNLAEKVSQLKSEGKRPPHLAAILVGNDGASETYVSSKVKSCEQIGFASTLLRLDKNISEESLIAAIEHLNNDAQID